MNLLQRVVSSSCSQCLCTREKKVNPEEGICHVLWSSAVLSGWADRVYVCWTVSEMAAWVLNDLSLTLPTFSDLQFNPAFLPCPLQDIYELKDQIQDVEGRYMQGLKELKVEGLELAACLLVFSGSSLAPLTLLFLLPLHPPAVAPTKPCICVLLFAWSSLLFTFRSNSPVVAWNEDTPTPQPGVDLCGEDLICSTCWQITCFWFS